MVKKILSAVLAVSMLSASAAVLAEEATHDIMLISENPEVSMDSPAIYDKTELFGTANINEGYLYIATETGDVMLNTDANTIFVDGNGYKTSVEAIEGGTTLKVIASHAMTMSLPPQSYAHVIMLADDNGGFPIYAEVNKVTTDDNGNFVFSSKDGNYDIVYGEGITSVEPFATRNIVTASDIKENSRILVFADVMTMSIPAMVPANRIVLLPEEFEILEKAPIEKVTVNGKELATDVASFIEKDSVILLPVRAIAEIVGHTVQWDDNLKAVTVGSVPMGVTFNIGLNSYTKARMMPQTLSAAPIAENGRTYVPVDFFTEILGATVVNENGTLAITLG